MEGERKDKLKNKSEEKNELEDTEHLVTSAAFRKAPDLSVLHSLPSLKDLGVKPRKRVSYSCSLATLFASQSLPPSLPDALTSLDTLRALTLLLTGLTLVDELSSISDDRRAPPESNNLSNNCESK